jgi:hypothetical protein
MAIPEESEMKKTENILISNHNLLYRNIMSIIISFSFIVIMKISF